MMQDFFNNFSEYKNCVPPGVRLPQIEIESKYYKSLKLDSSVDNFTFLTELCKNSLKKKKLDKQ